MNYQLEKLVKQATDTIEVVNPDTGITHHREFFDNEKFAELIVRSCVDVALAQKKWVEDQEVYGLRDVDWNKARVQQSQHIADKIKERFGLNDE